MLDLCCNPATWELHNMLRGVLRSFARSSLPRSTAFHIYYIHNSHLPQHPVISPQSQRLLLQYCRSRLCVFIVAVFAANIRFVWLRRFPGIFCFHTLSPCLFSSLAHDSKLAANSKKQELRVEVVKLSPRFNTMSCLLNWR